MCIRIGYNLSIREPRPGWRGRTNRGSPEPHTTKGLRQMKIVLFGATGQVGQRITAEALRRGHEVVGVVRDPSRAQSPDPRVPLVQGDATDAASVAAIVRGADAV